MPYLNSRLFALVATALSLAAVPGLHAQEASVAAAAVRGDVDGDGRVTRADADAVRAYLVRGTLPAGRSIMPAGDANGDGRVTAADAALISRFAAGVDVSRFPVGRPVGEGGGRIVASQGALVFTEFECGTTPGTGILQCEEVAAGGAGGARQDVLLYGTGAKIVPITPTTYADGPTRDTMKVTVAVTNLLPQAIGTTDGVTVDPVRLVFTGFTATNLPPNATVLTAHGTATFVDSVNGGGPYTFSNMPYMDFAEILAPNATSASQEVRIAYNPAIPAGQLKFKYRIWSRLQYKKGNVVITAADSIVGAGQTLALSGASYSNIGASLGTEAYNWISSNPGVASVNPSTGMVTGLTGGTVTITASSNAENSRAGTRVIRVIQANLENVGVTGNVRISSPASVLVNDSIHPNVRLTFYGWNGSPGVTQQGGVVGMDTTVAGGPNRGKFTYNPPAGFEGADSLSYVIRAGTAVDTGKVALNVAGMIWFVDANAGSPCTSRAAGCGRLTTPYSTLAAFNGENNGTGNNPAAGDAIFLYESAGTYAGPVTLLGQQKLIGQDAGASLATLAGITLASGSDPLPAMNPAGNPVTIGGGTGGVVLGADNLLRGFNITTSGGAALSGTGFGTPTIAEVSIAATAGPALSLNNGTLNSTFPSVTSTNSTGRGISLTAVSGTPTFTAGSISGSAQTALFVSGGNVGFTWPGSIGQSSVTPLLAVSGGHSGTLTFSGALTSTGGPGMQFNDADGVYNLNGTASLSGDSAAVDITNGSGGTFNFNNGTQITNAAGAANSAFYVYGSAPTLVSYAGSITKSGTSVGRLVELGEMTGGTVTFTGTSTLNSTSSAGTGISFSNVAATVGFNGTTTLNGGDAGIDILAASSGTFTFGANTLVQNPTGTAFNVNASAPAVTFNGSLIRTANNALLVDLTTVAAGKTILFDPAAGTDSLYATIGDGIQLSNVDGAVDFNGRVRLAGGNAGVDIINGSSGNIDFDLATLVNPTGDALRISNSSGSDQAADVSFAGSISTNAGRPVLVEDVGSGTVAVSASINATGQGLLVQNNSGGTVTFSNATQVLNTAGNAAVTLANNTGATLDFTGGSLAITTAAGAGFAASGGGTVNVTGSSNVVSSGTGTAVRFDNTAIGTNGVTFRSVSVTSGATNGIFLRGTGNSGGQFHVTGTGTAGSGGTIASTTGADGATGGNGVYLENANNVRLRRMQLNDHANHAVYGTTVSNVTLDSVVINGTNGTSLSGTFNEGSVHFETLSGAVMIRQSTISGGMLDNLFVANTSGAPVLNRLQLINNTIGGTINQDGVRLNATVGTFNVTATGNNFTYWEGDAFDMLAQGTATGDLVFQNNTVHNGNASPVSGSTNIAVGGGSFTYNISNNSFRGAAGAAIAVDESGSVVGNVSGTIDNNQIGAAGVTNSGSSQGSGIFVQQAGAGTSTTRVSNNTIRQINGTQAILIQVSDASAGGGNGTLNATVVGNNIQEEGSLAATRTAMNFNIGTVSGDAHTACLQIGGTGAEENSITNFDTNRYRVQHRFNTTVRMPGYGGGQYDVTAVGSYLTPRNDIGGQALTNNTSSSGTGGGFQNTAGGASCPQPGT